MINKLRSEFDENKIDALLVNNKANIFYLTGFKSTHGKVLVTKNHLYLFTDARYTEKAQRVVRGDWRVIDTEPGFMNLLHNILVKHRIDSFGIEGQDITVRMYKELKALNGFKIIDTNDLVKQIRSIKTEDELRALRQSQRLNEQVLKLTLDQLKVGITEAELVWRMQLIIHDIGGASLSFDPIVAFGAHTSMPHHESSNKKKLRRGDMILIDMGLFFKGYASDMTRTFFTKTPTSQQANVYETVLEANRLAIKTAKPGVDCDAVDKAARKHISSCGYSKKFGHGTGHGVGLELHELPNLVKFNDMVLQPGMVVTIEPGIYLPGRLGVRIEDMIEITEKGRSVLTKYPKVLRGCVLKV